MSTIDHLSRIFGSDSALARAAEVNPSTIYDWRKSGNVPAKRQKILLRNAPKLGFALKPDDFFQDDQPAA